jgi:hypothetical protein
MTHACRRVAEKRRSVAEAEFVTERVILKTPFCICRAVRIMGINFRKTGGLYCCLWTLLHNRNNSRLLVLWPTGFRRLSDLLIFTILFVAVMRMQNMKIQIGFSSTFAKFPWNNQSTRAMQVCVATCYCAFFLTMQFFPLSV